MANDADAIPSRVGNYEIVLPIAAGGMATVYLARAEGAGGFDRYVALKLTASKLKNDAEFSAHLIDEAKLVAHLRHPNVVPVFDVGECSLGVFLVMEYIPGDSFAGLVRLARDLNEELPPRIGLRILIDALHGLHAAHEHTSEDGHPLHIVHRDFSPQNILVGTDGVGRLTDFGIAKAASRVSNTEAGFVKGKLTYLAPEQAGTAPLDRRCDVWAAGVVAWELLAGRKLYQRTDPLTRDAVRPDPPNVKTASPEVSDALDDVVARALRVDRDARTKTALALANELSAAAEASSMLADTEEVAAYVVRLAEPELEERKELLSEARRQRDRRRLSAPDVRTMIGMAGPRPHKRAPLPTLPELPEPSDDGRSELRIAVDLKKPAERGDLDLPDAPALDHVEPEVFKSPVLITSHDLSAVASRPDLEPTAPAAMPAAEPAHQPSLPSIPGLRRAKTGWLTTLSSTAKGPWTTSKISIASGLAGTLIGFILVLVAITGKTTPRAGAAGSNASGSSSALASADPSSSVLEMPPDPPAKAVLSIKANAPIASVMVADRQVANIAPANTVDVDLEEGEDSRTLRIKVTGADGRVAVGNAEAGATELALTFPNKPAHPAPTSTPKHPWSKRH